MGSHVFRMVQMGSDEVRCDVFKWVQMGSDLFRWVQMGYV